MQVNWRARLAARGALLLMFSGALAGQPALTVIQDKLYKADGSLFDGIAFIQWKSFVTADASVVQTNSTTVRVISGNLRVQLAPTTTASPPAYYEVKYNSNGVIQFVEYWSVPPSPTPLRLRDVRIPRPVFQNQQAPSAGGLTGISDVPGLRDELDIRPVRGPAFTPSRAAIINSLGALESASGNPNDCVRVDGTSAPCGSGSTAGTPAPIFVDQEVPAGVVDGVNRTFTLANTPSPVTSLQVFRNGLLQAPGVDFTLSGNVLTFTAVSTPQAGDRILVNYRR